MTASPIIKGQFYHVYGCGIDIIVHATNPCDAIIVGVDLVWNTKEKE